MINFLVGVLVVLSIIIVISILMQPSKQNSAASAFTGGADQLFGKQKALGFEAVMQRTTAVLTGVWLLIAFIVVFLSSN